ncbi:sensor histidine kinase [Planobispora takensis]|uniref:histidine kinase n=1 Tax=Planobispora takensis TaxID=1367882 RepID=A0A8J3SXY5_9ACTN|nr:GAF domain-containing sensor histidine kinase [Planobispora takensis]GII00360.1 hypothetical protein Pta02_23680 [Planobispora takensis]
MSAASAVAAVLAVAWAVVALVLAPRPGDRAPARGAGLLAAAQATTAVWTAAVPVAIGGWFCLALALPDGRLGTPWRRLTAGTALLGGAVWTALSLRDGDSGSGLRFGLAFAGCAAVAGLAVALRCTRASARERAALQWTAACALLAGAATAVVLALKVLMGLPADPLPWVLGTLTLIPAGVLLGRLPATARAGDRALTEAVVISGFTVMVAAVYLVTVIGLGRVPDAGERDVLLAGMAAAGVVAVLALPFRARMTATAQSLIGRTEVPPEELLATFGARMSRAVPFDELLLQLAESLRATLGQAGAEVWVGAGGVLTRTVSVPDRPQQRLELDERERVVVGRTRVAGAGWLAVWLPALPVEHPQQAPVRVAPVSHLGELLGLIVVRRPGDGLPYTEEDDRVLVELARQVGLALHNMRLDSALQESLEELRRRNEELQASRLRIVTAADAARRSIERDLHDGAQQHLVALSVKLGLAAELAGEDPDLVKPLLAELREDVQQTITAVRELAHGVYPPLLRNHGLGQALNSAARRSPLPCAVEVDLPDRYSEEIEAAVYFCCLEAMQNAGKYAGDGAAVTVEVSAGDSALRFEVADDGAGFTVREHGHGFVNMRDRLGAVGGGLTVESGPGSGTRVRGEIPLTGPVRRA